MINVNTLFFIDVSLLGMIPASLIFLDVLTSLGVVSILAPALFYAELKTFKHPDLINLTHG